MGKTVGAAIVAHHPGLFRPEAERIAMGNGRDSDLVEGFHRLRKRIDGTGADTLVIFDTHWFTSGRHVIAGAPRYAGTYTSTEMPWILHDIRFDYPGAPELAAQIARLEAGEPLLNVVDPARGY